MSVHHDPRGGDTTGSWPGKMRSARLLAPGPGSCSPLPRRLIARQECSSRTATAGISPPLAERDITWKAAEKSLNQVASSLA